MKSVFVISWLGSVTGFLARGVFDSAEAAWEVARSQVSSDSTLTVEQLVEVVEIPVLSSREQFDQLPHHEVRKRYQKVRSDQR